MTPNLLLPSKKQIPPNQPVAHMFTTEELYRDHVSSSSSSHARGSESSVDTKEGNSGELLMPHVIYERQQKEKSLRKRDKKRQVKTTTPTQEMEKENVEPQEQREEMPTSQAQLCK